MPQPDSQHSVLEKLKRLHRPITRYSLNDMDAESFDSAEYALMVHNERLQYGETEEQLSSKDLVTFQICQHCSDLETNGFELSDTMEYFPGYEASIWPCATARVLHNHC